MKIGFFILLSAFLIMGVLVAILQVENNKLRGTLKQCVNGFEQCIESLAACTDTALPPELGH